MEQIVYVMQEAFNSVGQGWTQEDSKLYVQEYFHKLGNFVAKTGDQVIGFIVADKHSDHLFIDAIGVLPQYMNQGVAKKLWAKELEFCRENNVGEIKLIADPKSAAYLWYKKLMFKETGWVELSLKC